MRKYKASQAPGFFDVELRTHWPLAKGNPLSGLDEGIDWEGFRPRVESIWSQPAQGTVDRVPTIL